MIYQTSFIHQYFQLKNTTHIASLCVSKSKISTQMLIGDLKSSQTPATKEGEKDDYISRKFKGVKEHQQFTLLL